MKANSSSQSARATCSRFLIGRNGRSTKPRRSMSPQPGTKVTLVPPSSVKEAKAADDANPGEVTTVTHREPRTQEEKETKRSWIEIEMVDEIGAPVAGTSYRRKIFHTPAPARTPPAKG